MNDGQFFSQLILDYLQTYTSIVPMSQDPQYLLKEFMEHWNSHGQNLASKKDQTYIQLLDLQTQISQKQQLLMQHEAELKNYKNSSDRLIRQIDVRQTELIQLEKKVSIRKHTDLSSSISELEEGFEICQATFETVKSELKANHKVFDSEKALSQQLKIAHVDLLKADKENKKLIIQLQQETQLNTKKLIKSLNIATDMRSMILNQRQVQNLSNSLSLSFDDNKQIQSLINKLETTQISKTNHKFDSELIESLQQILELKEEISKIGFEVPQIMAAEQTEELITCDRTYSTPRFQSSVRFKAQDVLPNIRIRTEAEDACDNNIGKRISTDCGYYDETEKEMEEEIRNHTKAPWHSRKSINFERNRKKKLSYISVASFPSQNSLNEKQNLQQELNYLDQINEYYYSKKIVDENGFRAPPQSPLDCSTTSSDRISDKKQEVKGSSWFKSVAKIGIGIGIGICCYKLFKK